MADQRECIDCGALFTPKRGGKRCHSCDYINRVYFALDKYDSSQRQYQGNLLLPDFDDDDCLRG